MVDAQAVHGHAVDDLHSLGIAKVHALFALGHDDGVLAVGRVVHVIGIVDVDGLAFFAGVGINFSELIAEILGHP